MFKRKYIMQALLVVMMVLALAAGAVGCAGQSQPTAGNSATANTDGGGQTDSATVNTTDGGQTGSASENTTGKAAEQPGQLGKVNDSGLEHIKKALAGLVTDGTITQDQADKVTQAYSKAFADGSMRIQGGARQQNSGQIQNPILAPLASNGTLNQNQVNAINKAISQERGPGSGDGGGG